ncbi:MAG: DUF6456 domain-containing protein [Rhizobium altiplani]|uniref:DUF6456 domain-containing protein n=1 Tax=Rhizobium altiplani TaxID=1864509 RepID=UPI0030F2AC64
MRLKERSGRPFLPNEALAAGERLLAGFTRGQLQPRITASWEPQQASRAKGERGGMADLADSSSPPASRSIVRWKRWDRNLPAWRLMSAAS